MWLFSAWCWCITCSWYVFFFWMSVYKLNQRVEQDNNSGIKFHAFWCPDDDGDDDADDDDDDHHHHHHSCHYHHCCYCCNHHCQNHDHHHQSWCCDSSNDSYLIIMIGIALCVLAGRAVDGGGGAWCDQRQNCRHRPEGQRVWDGYHHTGRQGQRADLSGAWRPACPCHARHCCGHHCQLLMWFGGEAGRVGF